MDPKSLIVFIGQGIEFMNTYPTEPGYYWCRRYDIENPKWSLYWIKDLDLVAIGKEGCSDWEHEKYLETSPFMVCDFTDGWQPMGDYFEDLIWLKIDPPRINK